MKNLCDPAIAKYRDHGADKLRGVTDADREWGGAFLIPFTSGMRKVYIRVIASRGDHKERDETLKWDHVSVSLSNRCPTWDEMDFIKRLFFKPEETAFQLHVPDDRHISNHPYCLHLWRPVHLEIPRPPDILVGIRGIEGSKG